MEPVTNLSWNSAFDVVSGYVVQPVARANAAVAIRVVVKRRMTLSFARPDQEAFQVHLVMHV